MNHAECDFLDDYLGGWLAADQAARFENHLGGCPACRQDVERQRRIDRLLAHGAAQLQPAPASLIVGIEQRVRHESRRRKVRWACGAAASVAVALAAGVALLGNLPDTPAPVRPIAPRATAVKPIVPRDDVRSADAPPGPVPTSPAEVLVTLKDPSAAILLPVETRSPNVSIVWVCPTVKPARPAGQPADE
ncbi:MAG: zf-HC2 domain-containing protein [Pirellulales bacterium]|nr:zf-HC2 domain-containing protein [Pirellulales bacterium]